jgi:hypothetical protein
MRYRLLAVFVIGCASSPTASTPTALSQLAPAEPAAAPSTNGAIDLEMVASIDGFYAAPTRDAAAPILSRIADDEGVTVKIPGQLMSLLTGPGIDEDTSGLLLTGFTAGVARPQYATGIKRDDFLAGLRGLLSVYRALGVTSAQLDEAAARDRAGTLDAWAHDWLAAHPSDGE